MLVYARHILLVMLLIAPVAGYQAYHFYPGFTLSFFVAPLTVALVVGSLLGRAVLLKQRLSEQREQFRAIADLAREFTYYRRADGRYEYVSPASLDMTGYAPDAFYSTRNLMDSLIHPEDVERWQAHVQAVNNGYGEDSFEVRLVARDGRIVWVRHICAPVCDRQGRQIGVRSTNIDITRHKDDEQRIQHMAYFDQLTDLPNRRSLGDAVAAKITSSDAEEDGFALLFIDLHRFKHINDSFGHRFGDRLLQEMAGRLGRCCDGDWLLSRFGGDEFVVLLPGGDDQAHAEQVARRLLSAIEQPLKLDGVDLHVSAGIGISLYPEDGADADSLIRNADVAMYKSKRGGNSHINFYSSHFSVEAVRLVTTEGKVQKALANGEFVAFYQPKVDIRSGRIVGLEALARWRHPEQGIITPEHFIAVSEETGQIKELGRQILEHVLRDVAHWLQDGVALPVAINVSARQFADHQYCAELGAAIEESGCPRSLLELEITEQVFLGDSTYAIERMHKLREAGLSIALDDFGTGYSSFNYIKLLPINTLKIDRCFISHIDSDPAEHAILKALVSLCEDLNLDMVVEGVETEVQKQALLELGCHSVQGFFFHRPVAAEEISELLMRQRDGVGTRL